jgi:putative flippase GtrA
MKQVFKYFLVGGIAASFDIGFFMLFAGLLDFHWLPISIASFILATLINYIISINYVFESGARYQKKYEIASIFLISGSALIFNQAVLYATIVLLAWPLLMSKLCATGLVFFWNYLWRSLWLFKKTVSSDN